MVLSAVVRIITNGSIFKSLSSTGEAFDFCQNLARSARDRVGLSMDHTRSRLCPIPRPRLARTDDMTKAVGAGGRPHLRDGNVMAMY
jgi:hypothetical protein